MPDEPIKLNPDNYSDYNPDLPRDYYDKFTPPSPGAFDDWLREQCLAAFQRGVSIGMEYQRAASYPLIQRLIRRVNELEVESKERLALVAYARNIIHEYTKPTDEEPYEAWITLCGALPPDFDEAEAAALLCRREFPGEGGVTP